MPNNPPVLLDQFGRPIQREVLNQRIAAANLMGVRQAVHTGASRGLDPERLAVILMEADENNPERYLELAEEIEEKDLHYLSVLGTRKRQVSQLPISVQSASRDPADQDLAKMVQQDLIDTGVIDAYLFDMLDAVGKGFSVGEIVWSLSSTVWKPDRIEFVDPRFIRHDLPTRRIPLLKTTAQPLGEPLAPFKFIYVELKAKSGIPIRGGLARPAAWAYMFKNYTIKDWVQFCEVFGLPLRIGKFPPGASQEDKDELLRAVAQIAVDAAGIIPTTMQIEFIEAAQKGSSVDLFEKLARFFDEQVSKAVLGQTGTTDSTPGKLGGTPEHQLVREDIERADAAALTVALNKQLVRPYIDLNRGPQVRYPALSIGREDSKDAGLMADVAAKLVPLGLKVRQKDILQAAGFTEAQEGDDLLQAQSAPPSMGLPGLPAANPSPLHMLAAYAAGARSSGDAIDRAVDDQLGNFEEIMAPIAKEIEAAARASKTPEEFKRHLSKIAPTLDVSRLGNNLAEMMFASLSGGFAGDTLEPEHTKATASWWERLWKRRRSDA